MNSVYTAVWQEKITDKEFQTIHTAKANNLSELRERMISVHREIRQEYDSVFIATENDQLIFRGILPPNVTLLRNKNQQAWVFSHEGKRVILINPSNTKLIQHMAYHEDYGNLILRVYSYKWRFTSEEYQERRNKKRKGN